MKDPLRDLPTLAAEVDAMPVAVPMDATRLEAHRLTPEEMIRVGLNLSAEHGPGPLRIGMGYVDGLIDLLLFLPIDQVNAVRSAILPAAPKPESV